MSGDPGLNGTSGQDPDALLAALKAADVDRYLALLLMPAEARADLAALYLFNAEIALIRERVREPLPGEVRLQWWRDVLEGGRSGEAASHPVAAALTSVIDRRSLPVAPLIAMCEARIFDLYDDPMPDRASYEGYAGETASALLQLSAFLIDPKVSAGTATASGHAGVAQAVAGHLMMLPHSRQRGQVFLPGDLLAATGLDRDAFLKADNEVAVTTAIRAFAGFGREHLAKARAALAEVPAQVRSAYLPVALAEPVFDRAETLGGSCLSTPPRFAQWRRQWQLWRAARRGQI